MLALAANAEKSVVPAAGLRVAEGVVEEVLPCLAIARILSALTTKPDADSLSGSMLKAVFIERNESATLRALPQTRYAPFS